MMIYVTYLVIFVIWKEGIYLCFSLVCFFRGFMDREFSFKSRVRGLFVDVFLLGVVLILLCKTEI